MTRNENMDKYHNMLCHLKQATAPHFVSGSLKCCVRVDVDNCAKKLNEKFCCRMKDAMKHYGGYDNELSIAKRILLFWSFRNWPDLMAKKGENQLIYLAFLRVFVLCAFDCIRIMWWKWIAFRKVFRLHVYGMIGWFAAQTIDFSFLTSKLSVIGSHIVRFPYHIKVQNRGCGPCVPHDDVWFAIC